MRETTAKRIFLWTLGLYVLLTFLMTWLGDEWMIEPGLYWKVVLTMTGVTAVAGIPWVLVMEKEQRRTVLIGLGLTSAFYVIKILLTS